jgi:hypothetical protein
MAENNMKINDEANHARKKSSQRKADSNINSRLKRKKSALTQAEPVADKYFGAFKVSKWPEDLGEFLVELIQNDECKSKRQISTHVNKKKMLRNLRF